MRQQRATEDSNLFVSRQGRVRTPSDIMPAFRSCVNVRDLGGYKMQEGCTPYHRFVRCGGTRSLTQDDLDLFRDWGVTRVLDLRGAVESPRLTCRFSNQPWVTWVNVPLYDVDISSPAMVPADNVDNYLVSSYLHMLSANQAIRRIFEFFSEARASECTLFHCAAGMDRTGMVAMLLLDLAGVPREQIMADYAYSFSERKDVDVAVAAGVGTKVTGAPNLNEPFGSYLLRVRLEAIATVYDTLIQTYGSAKGFLLDCGVSPKALRAVWGM